MREEGERAREEAGEASAAAASQPAASPRQDAEPEELAAGLLRLLEYPAAEALAGCQACPLVEPSLWGLAVSCDPSNFYVCKRGMQKIGQGSRGTRPERQRP